MFLESSEDWWDEAGRRLGEIIDDCRDGNIDKSKTVELLNDLMIETSMIIKLEDPIKDELFQYQGIAHWIKNVIDDIDKLC